MNETIITATVKLRAVQPDDEEFLISVYASSREQELAMVPWTDEQRYVFAKFQFQAQLNYYQTEFPNSEHSIILSEGEPVGRLFIDRREAQIRILDITILTRHRGKGIGTPIIRHVMDLAGAAGKSVGINLDLFSTSQQTFERLGFKPTEKTDSHTLYVWQSGE
jgi:RimJ/RimL family protein N-acetyltransferase